MSLAGRWRITEMELWDRDAIDLLGPAFMEIGPRNDGNFGDGGSGLRATRE